MPARKPQSDYQAMLRDPRWQKRRLEILSAHEFKCDECGDTKHELQVHHCWYTKGSAPWEYEDACYRVLCNGHHEQWHDNKAELDQAVSNLSLKDLQLVCGMVQITDSNRRESLYKIVESSCAEQLLNVGKYLAYAIDQEIAAAFKRGKEAGK